MIDTPEPGGIIEAATALRDQRRGEVIAGIACAGKPNDVAYTALTDVGPAALWEQGWAPRVLDAVDALLYRENNSGLTGARLNEWRAFAALVRGSEPDGRMFT